MIYGIYVASRVKHAPMWRQYREAGAPIISTWIDEDGEGETADFGDLWVRIQREVSAAERLVFFAAADDFPFKGALVEVGMAIASHAPVYLCLASGVQLEPRSLRPLGSWARHPQVTWVKSLDEALGISRAPASNTGGGNE